MPRHNKTCIKSLLTLFGFALFAALQLQAQDMGQMPPAKVTVHTVEKRTLIPTKTIQGDVVSLNDARVAAQVEGQLMWIAMPGTIAKKGDVLARIDNSLLSIDLQHSKAELARLQADLIFRESEVQRLEALASTEVTSRSRLQQAKSQEAMLRQQIVQAKADIQRVERDWNLSEVKAPFDGVLVSRAAAVGEYIQRGDTVGRLVDNQQIEVTVSAPIALSRYLQPGTKVAVVAAGQTHHLPIRTIISVGDTLSRMMEVRLNAADTGYVVGQSVNAMLPSGLDYSGPALHRDALILRGRQHYIYKIGADNQAEQIEARILLTVDDWVALEGGIKTGDQVVIRGGERLQPGQAVEVKAQ